MKTVFFLISSLFALSLTAQTITVERLPQVRLSKLGIPPADYSGITRISGNRYAVVSDQESTDGFYLFTLRLDSLTGELLYAHRDSMRGNPNPQQDAEGRSIRDCEGIVYCPSLNTLFISGEGDQQILGYDTLGHYTGRNLEIPPYAQQAKIAPNYGFEALAYSPETKLFWTTTESTLKVDGEPASITNAVPNLLRFQSFGHNLRPAKQYAYRTESPEVKKQGRIYAFGVPAITALPDGRLLVLEREFYVSEGYIGSWVKNKLFVVNPAEATPITASTDLASLPDSDFLQKQLLTTFTTSLKLKTRDLANYEGMCLGPKLEDGRQTLLLISDAQGGFGNSLYKMKDFLQVLLLDNLGD